jgi:hypothetical protein
MFALHHLRLLLLLVAFGLAGTLAWRLMLDQTAPPPPTRESSRPPVFERAIAPPTPETLAAERQTISDRVYNIPEFADFIARLSATYPADWNKMLDAFARRALAARALDAPEAYISDTLRALRRDRGNLASKAGPEELTRVFNAQEKLLSGLAGADKRLCVDFLLGQASPAFIEFSGKNRPLLASMATSSLDAVIDGDKRKIQRDPPSDADFDLLEVALAQKGLGKPEIALRSVPDDARMRLYALAIQAMGKS